MAKINFSTERLLWLVALQRKFFNFNNIIRISEELYIGYNRNHIVNESKSQHCGIYEEFSVTSYRKKKLITGIPESKNVNIKAPLKILYKVKLVWVKIAPRSLTVFQSEVKSSLFEKGNNTQIHIHQERRGNFDRHIQKVTKQKK